MHNSHCALLYNPKGSPGPKEMFNQFMTRAKELGRTADYSFASGPSSDVFNTARASMAHDGFIGSDLVVRGGTPTITLPPRDKRTTTTRRTYRLYRASTYATTAQPL